MRTQPKGARSLTQTSDHNWVTKTEPAGSNPERGARSPRRGRRGGELPWRRVSTKVWMEDESLSPPFSIPAIAPTS
ncbi:hypothetical protein OJAV_G00143810 [Oryzias javanicus]|uniref:Uncharacterized protein n=1 Tax=Oryzias javanicus TaxID=123683 RepID=A0A437CN45_ORYJA|nr:hypothetical protein OJAV_G00143810 [Oryzias javanicus]